MKPETQGELNLPLNGLHKAAMTTSLEQAVYLSGILRIANWPSRESRFSGDQNLQCKNPCL